MEVLRRFSSPAGILGVLVLAAAAVYYGLFSREFDGVTRALVALGIVLVAYYLWFNTETVGQGVRGRSVRAGSSTTLTTIFFVGSVGLICFLSLRYSQRWDLTAAKSFSLSPQSINVVKSLQQPVNVYAFFTPGEGGRKQQAEDLLKEYQQFTDKLQVQFVDPNLRPDLVERYQLAQSGTVVFDASQKRQSVTAIDEASFTAALVKLTTAERKVYFLTGHGEPSLESPNREGYSAIKQALENDNFSVATLNLVSAQKVPDDATALIIAAPRQPLQPDETKAIADYLQQGGRALVLADPRSEGRLAGLLEPWGVQVPNGIIIDPDNAARNSIVTLAMQRYQDSPITRALNGIVTIFPSAAAVVPVAGGASDLSVAPTIVASEKSWIETDPQTAQYDEGVDVKGPVPLMVTVETKPASGSAAAKLTRLVVIGDSDFASNALVGPSQYGVPVVPGNRDLFVNSVNWLTQSEELISIRSKPAEDRSIVLRPAQASLVYFSSAFVLPLIVLAAGVMVWWSRR